MRRKLLVFSSVLLLAGLCIGCGQAKKVYSTEDRQESEKQGGEEEYEENGFVLKSAQLSRTTEGVGALPEESDIVFSINGVIDGRVMISDEVENVLTFIAEYEVDSDVSGTLKIVLTDEDGKTYTHENDTDFAVPGSNTFEAYIKTKETLAGEYTLEWYIDSKLAGEASITCD